MDLFPHLHSLFGKILLRHIMFTPRTSTTDLMKPVVGQNNLLTVRALVTVRSFAKA